MTRPLMFQSYVVANKGKTNEQRELVYFGEYIHFARNAIRKTIPSGFDYGHINHGFETIAYLNEKSFLMVAK